MEEKELLCENIIQTISQWAKNAQGNQTPEIKKNANALKALLASPKLQRQIQSKAVERLVFDFAQSIKNITDRNQKTELLLKFYTEWKTKTDPKLLQFFIKKNKLV